MLKIKESEANNRNRCENAKHVNVTNVKNIIQALKEYASILGSKGVITTGSGNKIIMVVEIKILLS